MGEEVVVVGAGADFTDVRVREAGEGPAVAADAAVRAAVGRARAAAGPEARPVQHWVQYNGFGHYVNAAAGGRLEPHFFYDASRRRLCGAVHVGPGAQGPAAKAHGGAVATIMDDAMGQVPWQMGEPAATAYLHVDFRAPVPLGAPVRADAWVERADGRKFWTRAVIYEDRADAAEPDPDPARPAAEGSSAASAPVVYATAHALQVALARTPARL